MLEYICYSIGQAFPEEGPAAGHAAGPENGDRMFAHADAAGGLFFLAGNAAANADGTDQLILLQIRGRQYTLLSKGGCVCFLAAAGAEGPGLRRLPPHELPADAQGFRRTDGVLDGDTVLYLMDERFFRHVDIAAIMGSAVSALRNGSLDTALEPIRSSAFLQNAPRDASLILIRLQEVARSNREKQ